MFNRQKSIKLYLFPKYKLCKIKCHLYNQDRFSRDAAQMIFEYFIINLFTFRLSGAVGSESDRESRGRRVDPRFCHTLPLRICQENVSSAILTVQLIQERHLSHNCAR